MDQSATRSYDRVGLGLHIASMVASIDGTIDVHSSPGAGSTFTVSIPLATARTLDGVSG